MKISLRDFFKYYDDKLQHHVDSVSQLEKDLGELAPQLLDDSAEWVKIYRQEVGIPPQPEKDIILPVPYYPQTDNYTQPERTCNSSACAMALEYFRPGTLQGPKGDDEYIREVFSVGDTTDHDVQTQVLKSYGVDSEFRYNLGFNDLDHELENKRPVVIGILHRGTLDNPTGGHMIVVIGRNEKGDYIVNDPYGDLYDGYTSSVYNGKGAIYERHVLEKRWTVANPHDGWGRIFHAKVEPVTSEPGKVPQAGLELIKEFEGLHVLKSDGMVHAYPDPLSGGKPYTIGWGSTKDLDGSPFNPGDKITREKADLLLEHQAQVDYLAVLEKTIPYWDEMNDNQHGALLSFAYNLGARFYGAPGFDTISRVLRDHEWGINPLIRYQMRCICIEIQGPLSKQVSLVVVLPKEISGYSINLKRRLL